MKPQNSASTIDELLTLLNEQKKLLGGDSPLVILSNTPLGGMGHSPSIQTMVLRGDPVEDSHRYGSKYVSGGNPMDEEYMEAVRRNDPEAKAGTVLF